jgi:SWI/SNF-related matrix-associated actin-dependent regulator 1 of chromatin subfamily A
MGLGKTAQLISYLGAVKALDADPGPHLVVVPASLLENWQRELRRWCPSLKSVVYYGKHRGVVRRRLTELRARLAAGEVVDDDLADLQDPDALAEAAASERLAEADAAAADDGEGAAAGDDDPYGLADAQARDSDGEFDAARPDAEPGAPGGPPPPEPPPPTWDFAAPLAPAPFHVMLTSYTLFERDSPDQREDRAFLESFRWSHLVMDEAHALKNRSAQRTTRLRRVAAAARRRVMMTGTPLQNDLSELQSLLHLLLPQVFAASGLEDFAEVLAGGEAEVARLTDRMKQLLGPFVLRRLKAEVAGQLTEKRHVLESLEMAPPQAELYAAAVAGYKAEVEEKKSRAAAAAAAAPGAADRFLRAVGAKRVAHMFTHLRKIAQHPLLVRARFDDAAVAAIAARAFEDELFSGAATERRVLEELESYSDYSLHAFCYNAGPAFARWRLGPADLLSSAKFRFLAELLPRLKAAGSRPLIFSQWTSVLDVLEWLMDELRLPYVRLDGSTAVDERLATVDKFNLGASDDVFAFLLSTRAGGQGLNLTGADTVILHDVDFNPQIDRQAEDRCHRLGQTRPVSVYRLVAKGSVDENIYRLSQRKLRLDAAVLDGITTGSGRGAAQKAAAGERQQMGAILHNLFAGVEEEADAEEAKAAAAGVAEAAAVKAAAEAAALKDKAGAAALAAKAEKANGVGLSAAAPAGVKAEAAANGDAAAEVKAEPAEAKLPSAAKAAPL